MNSQTNTDALKAMEAIRTLEEKYLSAIQGSLIGGAIGDALGYTVEFISLKEIIARYGENGIQAYDYDFQSDLALISDDTQMTLYTAVGLLVGFTRGRMRGIMGSPQSYIYHAYMDWYHCQKHADLPKNNTSWLSHLPEMHQWRAPGGTCLRALGSGEMGSVEESINNSKGCGGVMRVAPIALYFKNTGNLDKIDLLGAEAAAITHGHPLGFISAAALVHIVSRAAFGGCIYDDGLRGIVRECAEVLPRIFPDFGHVQQMVNILNLAMELSLNDKTDVENIRRLGEGWVGEEALGVAVYCCLRHSDDFSAAVIAAVNHDGDSDSTGAIAGNIIGAWLGMEAIDEKWLRGLELKQEILEVAKDLCDECQMSEYSMYNDPAWERKYIRFGE